MRPRLSFLALFGLLLASSGCKDSDDPLTQCVNLSACGGELEGTWDVSTVCYPDGEPQVADNAMCPEQTVELKDTSSTGSITFSSDGSYQADLTTTIRYDITAPLSCLGGTSAGCELAESGLMLAGFAGGCAVVGDNCVCDVSVTGGGAEQGTYETNGTRVTLTDSGGDTSSGDYCVESSRLGYLRSDIDDAGNTYQTNILLTKG